MVLPILTISSLLSTGVFLFLYRRELNSKKDIEAKYQATKEFAEKAGSTILKLQSEKKEVQTALTMSKARNHVNTIAKTADKAIENRVVLQGEEKPKARRGRRKKPNANVNKD